MPVPSKAPRQAPNCLLRLTSDNAEEMLPYLGHQPRNVRNVTGCTDSQLTTGTGRYIHLRETKELPMDLVRPGLSSCQLVTHCTPLTLSARLAKKSPSSVAHIIPGVAVDIYKDACGDPVRKCGTRYYGILTGRPV